MLIVIVLEDINNYEISKPCSHTEVFESLHYMARSNNSRAMYVYPQILKVIEHTVHIIVKVIPDFVEQIVEGGVEAITIRTKMGNSTSS